MSIKSMRKMGNKWLNSWWRDMRHDVEDMIEEALKPEKSCMIEEALKPEPVHFYNYAGDDTEMTCVNCGKKAPIPNAPTCNKKPPWTCKKPEEKNPSPAKPPNRDGPKWYVRECDGKLFKAPVPSIGNCHEATREEIEKAMVTGAKLQLTFIANADDHVDVGWQECWFRRSECILLDTAKE